MAPLLRRTAPGHGIAVALEVTGLSVAVCAIVLIILVLLAAPAG